MTERTDAQGRLIWGTCRHCGKEVAAESRNRKGLYERPDAFHCVSCDGELWRICQECGSPSTNSRTGLEAKHEHYVEDGRTFGRYL